MKYQIIVSKNGNGDFESISEAIDSIPYDNSATIYVKNGIYHEKLFIQKKNIGLIGEDPEKTVVTWHDGAYFQHPDGKKFGTFRSYTVYLGGEKVVLKNLTIENTAGSGDTAGQAIAVYADADFARFENIRLESCQDTLFLAPLPDAPRIPGSFIGPGENLPRKACKDYFENCQITGDIDFIFGGAESAFSNCTIFSKSRNKNINGYISAASTPQKQEFGFLFYKCTLLSNCPKGTVYLGRPWREFAKTSFIQCNMDSHIADEGWMLWNPDSQEKSTVHFSEYENIGKGANGNRAAWTENLTKETALQYIKEVHSLSSLCNYNF